MVIAAVPFAAILGSPFGISIGFTGGRVGALGSRIIDRMFGLPSIVLSIPIIAVPGVRSRR